MSSRALDEGIQGNASHQNQKEDTFNLKLKKRNESRRGLLWMMLTGRDGPKQVHSDNQAGRLLRFIPKELVLTHRSMSTSRLKGWRSCDQGHRYTPNPVEHSRLVIPQSCEARITDLLAQRPFIHALCLLTSHQTAVCWTVSWEFVHPLPKTAFFLLSKG